METCSASNHLFPKTGSASLKCCSPPSLVPEHEKSKGNAQSRKQKLTTTNRILRMNSYLKLLDLRIHNWIHFPRAKQDTYSCSRISNVCFSLTQWHFLTKSCCQISKIAGSCWLIIFVFKLWCFHSSRCSIEGSSKPFREANLAQKHLCKAPPSSLLRSIEATQGEKTQLS